MPSYWLLFNWFTSFVLLSCGVSTRFLFFFLTLFGCLVVGVLCPVLVASLTTDRLPLPCSCPIFVALLTTDQLSLSWLSAFPHLCFVVLPMSQGSIADPDGLFIPSGSAYRSISKIIEIYLSCTLNYVEYSTSFHVYSFLYSNKVSRIKDNTSTTRKGSINNAVLYVR